MQPQGSLPIRSANLFHRAAARNPTQGIEIEFFGHQILGRWKVDHDYSDVVRPAGGIGRPDELITGSLRMLGTPGDPQEFGFRDDRPPTGRAYQEETIARNGV